MKEVTKQPVSLDFYFLVTPTGSREAFTLLNIPKGYQFILSSISVYAGTYYTKLLGRIVARLADANRIKPNIAIIPNVNGVELIEKFFHTVQLIIDPNIQSLIESTPPGVPTILGGPVEPINRTPTIGFPFLVEIRLKGELIA